MTLKINHFIWKAKLICCFFYKKHEKYPLIPHTCRKTHLNTHPLQFYFFRFPGIESGNKLKRSSIIKQLESKLKTDGIELTIDGTDKSAYIEYVGTDAIP